jgi:hypothetical protein
MVTMGILPYQGKNPHGRAGFFFCSQIFINHYNHVHSPPLRHTNSQCASTNNPHFRHTKHIHTLTPAIPNTPIPYSLLLTIITSMPSLLHLPPSHTHNQPHQTPIYSDSSPPFVCQRATSPFSTLTFSKSPCSPRTTEHDPLLFYIPLYSPASTGLHDDAAGATGQNQAAAAIP